MSFPRRNIITRVSFSTILSLQIQSPGKLRKSDSSGGETPGASFLSGSLTVEAALVLMLVIFSWTALLTLFSAMHIHLKLRYAMEQAAEEFAVFAYLTESGKVSGDEAILQSAEGGEWFNENLPYLQTGLTALSLRNRILTLVGHDTLDESCIRGGSQGVILSGGSGLTEEGDVALRLTYQIQIPFLPFPFSGMILSQQVVRHAWIGAADPMISGDGEAISGEKVFVTQNGTVYHNSDACAYLNPSIRSVDTESVKYLRSLDGSKYYPCERCMSGSGEGDVYITSEGNRYHSDLGCGSLKRLVDSVEKSETNLPACSKCGSGEGESDG